MEFLKESRFWSYLGTLFAVGAAACTGYAATLQSKETDEKIMNRIQQTIENGFKTISKEAESKI